MSKGTSALRAERRREREAEIERLRGERWNLSNFGAPVDSPAVRERLAAIDRRLRELGAEDGK